MSWRNYDFTGVTPGTTLSAEQEDCMANLITSDWEQAFTPQMKDPATYNGFSRLLEAMRTHGTEERARLMARNIGSLANHCFSEAIVDQSGTSLAVSRGKIYVPRNPLRRPYMYFTDALSRNTDALEASIQWCTGLALNAHTGREPHATKTVVDTISPYNAILLESIGFESAHERQYDTPDLFAPFVGDTFRAVQYTRQ